MNGEYDVSRERDLANRFELVRAGNLPKNFKNSLKWHLHPWKEREELVEFWAMYGHMKWTGHLTMDDLIADILKRSLVDIYFNVVRYSAWDPVVVRQNHKDVGINKGRRATDEFLVIDRSWHDIDAPDGADDAYTDQELVAYRKFQNDLAVGDKSPVKIIASGSGWHVYTLFDRTVDLETAALIQDAIAIAYEFRMDAFVGVRRAQLLRIPYSMHHSGNWVIQVGPSMSINSMRAAMRSPLEEGCHWVQDPPRVDPEKLLRTLGVDLLDIQEFREKKAEMRRQKKFQAFLADVKRVRQMMEAGMTREEILEKTLMTKKRLSKIQDKLHMADDELLPESLPVDLSKYST